MITSAAAGFAAALSASLVLTPLVRAVARKIGLTDRPDSHRKVHEKPVPLGGGLAVFLSTSVVLGTVLLVPNPWALRLAEDWYDVFAFFLAGGIIVLLGLVDDHVGLRGRHKLVGQIVAALILTSTGLVIQVVGMFGQHLELGLMAVPFTVFWLVGAINAINLLDGIDGLATVLGIILCGTIAAMAAITGHPAVALVALVFTGSLVGFLRYNFPPASIFLGDAGSMLIGLMVGALAIRASLKGPGTVLLAAPLAVCTIPIFDSVVAILRRKLTGRSIYTTDRGHLHHHLFNLLGSNRKVLACLAVCCGATSVFVLVSVFLKNDVIAVVGCLAIMLIFVVSGVFGRAEVSLLLSRIRTLGRSFAQPIPSRGTKVHQSRVRIQGSRPWDLLWETLTESAEKLQLRRIHLDLNLPAVQEGYAATWEKPAVHGVERCWRLDLPLLIGNQPVGRLIVTGALNGDSVYLSLEQLADLMEVFEARMRLLVDGSGAGHTDAGSGEPKSQKELTFSSSLPR